MRVILAFALLVSGCGTAQQTSSGYIEPQDPEDGRDDPVSEPCANGLGAGHATDEPDIDDDCVPDRIDNCPALANRDQADSDGDGDGDLCDPCPFVSESDDSDGDCVAVGEDNCALLANAEQEDSDGDGDGDLCDPCPFVSASDDSDGDCVAVGEDNCAEQENDDQTDQDLDGRGDVCDNCIASANPDQSDLDGDVIGDSCDLCPNDSANDSDEDGFCADEDDCPFDANADQLDYDHDGKGDECDSDDDADLVDDWLDNCALTNNADQLDTDDDAFGDACDGDDDDDFTSDEVDNCIVIANFDQADLDGDGNGDVCDPDDDGDLIPDPADRDPLCPGSSYYYPAFASCEPLSGSGDFGSTNRYSTDSGPYGVFTGDLNGDGYLDVATTAFNADKVNVLFGNGDGTFLARISYTVGDGPAEITGMDLDNDTDIDLVTSNSSTNTISVLRNQGDGAFATPVAYVVGDAPSGLAILDVNDDEAMDIVVAGRSSGVVSVLLGSSGSFASAWGYTAGTHPEGLEAADLDEDGDKDLIIAAEGSDELIIRWNSDGIFDASTSIAIAAPHGVVARDFDGDAHADVAITSPSAGSVSILRGDGSGTLSLVATEFAGESPQTIRAGDLDQDGDDDLLVLDSIYHTATSTSDATRASASCVVFVNQGDGSLSEGQFYLLGVLPRGGALGDFDGDGTLDLMAGISYSNQLALARGDGSAGLDLPESSYVGGYAAQIAAGDLDGDSDLDLSVIDYYSGSLNALHLLMNDGKAHFPDENASSIVAHGPHYQVVRQTLADLDRDGDLDWAVANGWYVSTITGDGTGLPESKTDLDFLGAGSGIAAADLDADGDMDLAATDTGAQVTVLLRERDGSFATHQPYTGITRSVSIEVADFDADGDIDLAFGSQAAPYTLNVLMNRGDGSFASVVSYSDGSFPPWDVEAGDLDDDGDIDLVTANNMGSRVRVFWNQGDGTFTDGEELAAAASVMGVKAGDVDGDGDMDLITVGMGGDTVLLTNDAGTFAARSLGVFDWGYFVDIALRDFDADGDLDMARTASYSGLVTRFVNR